MKWLRFVLDGAPAFGALQSGTESPDNHQSQVQIYTGNMFDAPTPTGQTVPLDGLEWLPPCQPTKMLALWNNFQAAASKNNWATPLEPLYFVKPANTFSKHLAVVERPLSYSGRILYEAELGVVIGKRGKNIALENAADHVFGYTCINDVTALEVLREDASFEQWTRAKGFDGFAPFGPFIETEVIPEYISVKAIVNGRERQNYPVSDMFFSPLQLVCLLSRDVTLEAGDVISCGTSLGAGPWQPGSKVEVVIDGVGSLSNTLSFKDDE